MADALPPDTQAVKDRATVITNELADWLQANYCDHDKRAAAVAMLRMGDNLHIEVMGQKAAMALLANMFSDGGKNA